jgi:heat shock protein HtpX
MIGNQVKTVMLLGVLSGLLIGVSSFFGRDGLIIGLVLAVLINFFSYFFSDKVVLAMYRAKEANEKEHHELYNLVKETAMQAKIPMPRVYVIPSESPNAFATGRNPKNAVVAVTDGIIQIMKKDELKGVIAHEMAHIKNRDILIATIAATIASVISYLAFMARWAALFGGFGGRDRDRGGGMIELLVLAILTPLIATIIQLAISRSREYLADESAGKITKQPYSLASALEKIDGAVRHHPMRMGNKTTASLFIANPFSGKSLIKMFSTHPPIEDRVKKLRAMSV